ncbi:Serine/threonine-protein kinase PknD [Pseudoalteromonas holothuriae]|uniref:Serine/threonine-protein kinase PknD n=1 Tax=Pseudoalteromonas holothuriae TaxID=2963714 RepID=A0ABM9GLS9_9GAMM|nr:Serine/threonine-protein kinase PknD [Pseudoalteromonas sp. CIP111951]
MIDLSTHYQNVLPIGQGGMSSVFLATDTTLGRKVALKVLNNKNQHSQSLLDEARLLAKLNHPNIVQIYNVREIDDCLVLEMEYVQGSTLYNFSKERHLDLEQKLSVLIDIAQGLEAAHKQQILHLDLKPANILVDDQGRAKIADFGISQLKGEQELASMSSFGSLTSMSPEQLREEPLDQRSDLFSFGLLAYQLLAGTHPYRPQALEDSDIAIAEQIKFTPLENSARAIIELPSALITLLDRLLQFNKDLRPNSADEVAMQLKQIIMTVSYDNSDPTVEISSVSLTNPKKAKGKLLAFFSFILFVVGLIGSGIWYWQVNKPKTYIAALPIKYDEQSSLTDTQQRIAKLGLDDAISNFILQDSSSLQVSNSEVETTIKLMGEETSLASLSKALGANILLEPKLSCRGSICEVILNAIDGTNATMLKSTRYSVDTESFSEAYRNSLSHVSGLFSQEALLDEVSDAFFDEYVRLIQAFNTGNDDLTKTLTDIQILIRRTPRFTPLYTLYRKVAIESHLKHSEPDILWDFLDVLENAPPSYMTSVNYIVDHILIYQALKEWQKAEKLIHSLVNRNIDAYELYSIKANYFREKAHYQDAYANILEAYKLRPTLQVTRNTAIIALLNGNYESALTYLNLVIKSAPLDHWALKTYADLSLIRGSTLNAIDTYKKLLLESLNDPDILSNLAIAQALVGEFELSAINAEKAYNLNPQHVNNALNFADSLLFLGKRNEADLLYQKVLRLTENSDNSDKLLARTQALLHLGRSFDALQLINKLETKNSGNYDLAFVKAMVLTILGEHQSALIAISSSISDGWGENFYTLPWFVSLCEHKVMLAEIISIEHTNTLCAENRIIGAI